MINSEYVYITWLEVWRSGGEEVEEAGTAVEFGEEEGGVGLRVRGGGIDDPVIVDQASPNGAIGVAPSAQDTTPITAQPHRSFVYAFLTLIYVFDVCVNLGSDAMGSKRRNTMIELNWENEGK